MTLKEANIIFKKTGHVPEGFKINHHQDCGYWWSATCKCHQECRLEKE